MFRILVGASVLATALGFGGSTGSSSSSGGFGCSANFFYLLDGCCWTYTDYLNVAATSDSCESVTDAASCNYPCMWEFDDEDGQYECDMSHEFWEEECAGGLAFMSGYGSVEDTCESVGLDVDTCLNEDNCRYEADSSCVTTYDKMGEICGWTTAFAQETFVTAMTCEAYSMSECEMSSLCMMEGEEGCTTNLFGLAELCTGDMNDCIGDDCDGSSEPPATYGECSDAFTEFMYQFYYCGQFDDASCPAPNCASFM